MTSILKLQKVYELVDGTLSKPDAGSPAAEITAWEDKDLAAQVLIKNNLSDEQMVHVDPETITTAAAMWQSLRAVHETRGHSAITAAKRTFYGTRAADDVNIPEHIATMRTQYNKLSQMGCKIPDEEFKSVLVMSLPPIWDHFVGSYQGTHTATTDKDGKQGITSQELTSILIDEYQRRTSQESRAYYAQSSAPSKKRKVMVETSSSAKAQKSTNEKCGICGYYNHSTSDCRFKGKPKCGKCHRFGHNTADCRSQGKPKCGSCHKIGHKTEDCWGKDGKPKERANIAQKDEDAEMSFVANSNVSPMNEDTVSYYLWYADSATTSHLTNIKSAFKDYESIQPIPIYGLGKASIWAYGRGTVEAISYTTGKPKIFHLKETLFVPDIADNLLSVGRVDNSGGKITFGDNKALLYDKNRNVVVDGKLTSNRLYAMNIYHRNVASTEKSNITTRVHYRPEDLLDRLA
jgi:hypothetical protein